MSPPRHPRRSGRLPGSGSAGSRPAGSPRSGPSAARPPRRAAGRRTSGLGAGRPGAGGSGARWAAGGLTGRAAALALVVCALVLSLAYPLKEYLAQRSDIAHLRSDRQATLERIAGLEERRAQLNDPSYIKTQARKRLQFVMPGESLYVVVSPTPTAGAQPSSSPPRSRPGGSWYDRLWRTVRAADRVPAS